MVRLGHGMINSSERMPDWGTSSSATMSLRRVIQGVAGTGRDDGMNSPLKLQARPERKQNAVIFRGPLDILLLIGVAQVLLHLLVSWEMSIFVSVQHSNRLYD